ncbi:MAG: aminoglycoside phosphotransferase family protein [Acidimicrobiales bacterium]
MDGSPRSARLVVADRSGTVLGITHQRRVDVPWWPETVSVLDAFNDVLREGAAIVRLLTAERRSNDRIDGHEASPDTETGWLVTYLAQAADEVSDSAIAALQPCPAAVLEELLAEASRHRMPWATVGGPAADAEWASSELRSQGLTPTTPARQHKTWNLSSVWEVPHEDGAAWLKTTPSFGRHETEVLRLLHRHPVPRVLAAEGHRQLLAALPGIDGFQATLAERLSIVDALVDIQLATADLVDEALTVGIPDRRTPALAAEVHHRLDKLGSDATRLTADLEDRLGALDRCGLPAVIVHADAHPGNARIGVDPPVIFDWSDAFVGNPIWDLRRVIDSADNDDRQVCDHWLRRWADAVPGADPWLAAELSAPLAPLLAAATYQLFVDEIEPSEHIYHRADVQAEIRAAAERTLPERSTGPRLAE